MNVDHHPAVVVADPAPDAVDADEVERRQVVAGGELGEALVEQLGVAAGGGAEGLGEGGLAGVEVGAGPVHAGGGGVEVDAQALAEAELAGGGDLGWGEAGVEQGQREAGGVELGVVAVGVADVGDVAGGPVGHGWCL